EGSRAVRVASLWHNSFDDVIGNTPTELTAALTAQFGTASLEGELPADATSESGEGDEEDEEVVASSLKVLASIEQGHRLRTDADQLEIDLNTEFGGKLIIAGKD